MVLIKLKLQLREEHGDGAGGRTPTPDLAAGSGLSQNSGCLLEPRGPWTPQEPLAVRLSCILPLLVYTTLRSGFIFY